MNTQKIVELIKIFIEDKDFVKFEKEATKLNLKSEYIEAINSFYLGESSTIFVMKGKTFILHETNNELYYIMKYLPYDLRNVIHLIKCNSFNMEEYFPLQKVFFISERLDKNISKLKELVIDRIFHINKTAIQRAYTEIVDKTQEVALRELTSSCNAKKTELVSLKEKFTKISSKLYTDKLYMESLQTLRTLSKPSISDIANFDFVESFYFANNKITVIFKPFPVYTVFKQYYLIPQIECCINVDNIFDYIIDINIANTEYNNHYFQLVEEVAKEEELHTLLTFTKERIIAHPHNYTVEKIDGNFCFGNNLVAIKEFFNNQRIQEAIKFIYDCLPLCNVGDGNGAVGIVAFLPIESEEVHKKITENIYEQIEKEKEAVYNSITFSENINQLNTEE